MQLEKILIRFPFIKQFAKFFIVGIMNTGVDLAILNILMFSTRQTEGIFYSFFKTLSFLAAVIFSYFINKHWTFQDKSEADAHKKFYQFIGISIIGAFINVTVATLVVGIVRPMVGTDLISGQLWGNIGALSGTAVGLFWNFIGYKFWVFKK
ncbi:MAG: GtrA family protein [Candidatus Moranbacteria bacterium]|nr:GtrA family protein [Candidatus Moranbacteria bacterium]